MSIWEIVAAPILKIIDKVIPDPAAKDAAKLELLKLQQAGEFRQMELDAQLSLAQTDINKVEAASSDPFKSNWRPAVGWVCVCGLAYEFLLMPLLPWLVTVCGGTVPALPALDNTSLMYLLGSLLGIGGMRTLEKVKGVA